MNATHNRLMVMAGGTGGHVFPALAVAKLLQSKGTEVTWLGTHRGIEATVVPANTIDMYWITVDGLRGKGVTSWLLAPFKLLRAIIQSIRAIRQVQPDCVLGMGGFVSGPGGLAARLLGKPIVIHEQNAVAGLTNKYLAKIANRVLTGFPQVQGLPASAKWVGNPVRGEIVSRSDEPINEPVNVLVIGGSQGAKSFNMHLARVFASQKIPVSIWHQSGKGKSDEVEASYADAGVAARVTEFIDDMSIAYDWADLLICRAGAMTIAECCAAAKPALLIPYPFSAGDHQQINAQFMVDAGAAKMLENHQLALPIMVSTLAELLSDKTKLKSMAAVACSLHKPNAAQDVMSACAEFFHA